ncbi:MAG: DUF4349 domain-containing protein [Mycobacteriales bacterium]
MRTSRPALAALLTVAVLLAGCSSGGIDSTASGAAAPQLDDADSSGGAAGGTTGGAGGGAGGGAAEALQVVDLRGVPGLAVIRTADLEVRVDDVRVAADEAGRLARSAGGAVEAEDRSGTASSGSATVRLRVPPKELDATVIALAALGDERNRRLTSEDATDQMVDLEARLATQRASVTRVRALLGEADALGEVVQIESELTKRTADLEALEARLESLSARVDLSTIVLRLDSEGGPVVGQALGFGDGLRSGWAALTATARVLAVTAGALLPFLPLLVGAGFLVWRARSRRTAVVQP